MFRMTIDVAETDTARRLIEGVAVPWNETAEVGFLRMRFAPGSLRLARDVTPLLLGHDTNSPVGVLTALEDKRKGARARFRVDRTEDGDKALAQAKSGSRSGLSIGFELDEYDTEADGTLDIHAASVYEVSLVAVPAFAEAKVERVAAHRAEAGDDTPADDDDDGGDDAGQDDDDAAAGADETEADDTPADDDEEGDDEMDESGAARGRFSNEGERRPMMLAERRDDRPKMRAGAFVQKMLAAERGDVAARELVKAALAPVTSGNAPGLLPPTYTQEILGGVDRDRALADTFRSSPPLPGTGLQITKPKWTTRPEGGWVVDGQATPSTAVQIDTQEKGIDQWAFGVLVSYATVERSTPDFSEAMYREAVTDYYADVEAKIAAEITTRLAVPALTLGAAVGAFVTARRSRPNTLLVGGTVYGEYIDAQGHLLYTTGAVDASGRIREYIAGLELVLASYLDPDAQIVTDRAAIDFREDAPIRLSANVIGTNSVELGVYSFAFFDTDKPDAFHPVATGAPLAGRRTTKA